MRPNWYIGGNYHQYTCEPFTSDVLRRSHEQYAADAFEHYANRQLFWWHNSHYSSHFVGDTLNADCRGFFHEWNRHHSCDVFGPFADGRGAHRWNLSSPMRFHLCYGGLAHWLWPYTGVASVSNESRVEQFNIIRLQEFFRRRVRSIKSTHSLWSYIRGAAAGFWLRIEQLAHACFWQLNGSEESGAQIRDDSNDCNSNAEALDVYKDTDYQLYFEQFVQPKTCRIRKWIKCRDEVAAAHRSQLGALLYEDVFTVLQQFLHANCGTKGELDALTISAVADGCEEQWFMRAFLVDVSYKTASYFVNAVKFILVGTDHWTAYLLRCRIGQPTLVARLIIAKTPISEDVGDDFFVKQSTDSVGPLFACVSTDSVYKGLAALRTVKGRMTPDLFQSQICAVLGSSRRLVIHAAIVRFAQSNRALDFEYMRQLVPSDLSATHFDEYSFVQSLQKETVKHYGDAHEDIWKKSTETLEKLIEIIIQTAAARTHVF